MISLKRKIKKFNLTFLFKKTLVITLFLSKPCLQSINSEIHFLENKKNPFWISSNNGGTYSKGSIINFKIFDELKILKYGFEILFPLNQSEVLLFNQAYLRLNSNNFYFQIGKKSKNAISTILSSGSLVESSNAILFQKY